MPTFGVRAGKGEKIKRLIYIISSSHNFNTNSFIDYPPKSIRAIHIGTSLTWSEEGNSILFLFSDAFYITANLLFF